MYNLIAKTDLIGIRPDGKEIIISIEVGKPYLKENSKGFEEWACPISLKPLYKNLPDIHGSNAFQALRLTSSLLLDLLLNFTKKGGELFLDRNNKFPFDAYHFGKK